MKVKEVNTTATIGWSPSSVAAPHLVCATAAVHADPATKNDALQIYSLNLREENLSMKLAGSLSTETRFHDVVWGLGGSQVTGGAGVVACAGNNGGIYVYNGKQLMTGGSNPLVTSMEKQHAGPVFTLDFNYHQPNLLASGSSDCEVFIWDINDPATPMSPGTKATLAADVTSVAWNRQVEHILASSYAGRCVVFDLRKSTSIIQISDAVSMVKASSVCWHPNVATQLALASADDSTPVVQIWDLRFASAPVRQCDGHQRGIQSLSWCQHDADMLCSAAKDNRVVCWSPSTGEVVCEFPSYNQWSFEAAWCPRDPALVATASVDGFVSVYSLLGGGYAPPRDVKFSAIADSFPGMDMPTEVPATVQPQHIYPRRPPSFFAPRAGCSFGFGGRLLTWHSGSRAVEVSQVVTEPQLVERSNQLLSALHTTQLAQYCADKLSALADDEEKEVWQYISASLYGEATSSQYLTLLGHPPPSPSPQQLSPQEEGALASHLGALGAADGGSTDSLDPSEQFEMIASAQSREKTPDLEVLRGESSSPAVGAGPRVLVSTEGATTGASIRKAVITGRLEEAVELCIQDSKYSLALVLAQHSSQHLYCKTRERVLSLETDSDEVCGVVSAVVRADLESVVTQCKLHDWREAVVSVITHASQEQLTPLLQRLGVRLESGGNHYQAALVCYLIAGALDNFVLCWVRTKSDGTASAALSTTHLQELVEVILVVQQTGRAISNSGSSGGGGAAEYLAQYATILSTQGALTTALHYLANNAAAQTEGELVALKDRLSQALGQSSSSVGAGAVRAGERNRSISTTSNSSLQGYRRTSTPSSTFQAAQFTPSVQARQASAIQPPAVSQPPSMFQPPAAASQPPSMFQPPAAASQPPSMFQPPAAASQPSSMYQPPTAASQPSSMYQPVQQQPHSFAPPTPLQQQQPAQFGYQPTAPSSVPPPAPPAATLSTPGGLRRQGLASRYVNSGVATPPSRPGMPLAPASATTGVAASMTTPFQPSSSITTNTLSPAIASQPPSFLDPGTTALPPPSAAMTAPPVAPQPFAVMDPLQQQQQGGAVPSKPPAAYDPSVKRGWNDPPPMSAARREGSSSAVHNSLPGCQEHSGARRLHNIKAKQQAAAAAAAPAGPGPAEGISAMVPTQHTPQQPALQGFHGFQSQAPPGGFGGPAAQPTPPPPVSSHQQPPTPVRTPQPIPPDAQPVYDVLNGLYCRALQSAPNMNMRQTIETVGPKLETLYDKLRTSQISAGTLQGLQSLVQCIQGGDYHSALQVHSHTVSAGNFAEMSTFMPAIKKLITTCMQCQIFLN